MNYCLSGKAAGEAGDDREAWAGLPCRDAGLQPPSNEPGTTPASGPSPTKASRKAAGVQPGAEATNQEGLGGSKLSSGTFAV